MKKTIDDFQVGDETWHISQNYMLSPTPLIVIYIRKPANEIDCRWITGNGKKQEGTFHPFELK